MSVFGVQNALKIVLCLGLFPGHLLLISELIFRRLGFPNRRFRKECIAKINFSWKSFLVNFGIEFYSFVAALGTVFSDFKP